MDALALPGSPRAADWSYLGSAARMLRHLDAADSSGSGSRGDSEAARGQLAMPTVPMLSMECFNAAALDVLEEEGVVSVRQDEFGELCVRLDPNMMQWQTQVVIARPVPMCLASSSRLAKNKLFLLQELLQ